MQELEKSGGSINLWYCPHRCSEGDELKIIEYFYPWML